VIRYDRTFMRPLLPEEVDGVPQGLNFSP